MFWGVGCLESCGIGGGGVWIGLGVWDVRGARCLEVWEIEFGGLGVWRGWGVRVVRGGVGGGWKRLGVWVVRCLEVWGVKGLGCCVFGRSFLGGGVFGELENRGRGFGGCGVWKFGI